MGRVIGKTLSGLELEDDTLEYIDCHLTDCTIKGRFVYFQECQVNRCSIYTPVSDGLSFRGLSTIRSEFKNCQIQSGLMGTKHCVFVGCELTDCDFGGRLEYTEFKDCNLTGTCLEEGRCYNSSSMFDQLAVDGSLKLIAYRTKLSLFYYSLLTSNTVYYEVGRRYKSLYFSHSTIACHPGLHVCPDLKLLQEDPKLQSREWPLITVLVEPNLLHMARAGSYRTPAFTVVGQPGDSTESMVANYLAAQQLPIITV